jgi:hypothetical protein
LHSIIISSFSLFMHFSRTSVLPNVIVAEDIS